jgi:LPS-assembly protein
VAFALAFLLARAAAAEVMPAEVRVLSAGGAAAVTTVTVRAQRGVEIDDRTAGARPQASRQGPISVGDTFTDEISVFLEDFTVTRPASIDVSDALVSMVRLFPEAGGTTVVVFVRQPVSYTIGRPSPLGEIAIVLRPRTVPAKPKSPTKSARVPGHRTPTPGAGAGTSGEVSVDAESLAYDQQTDTLSARGDVTLTRGGVTLRADEVEYNRTTQLAEARGNVVMIDPDATVTGDRAHLNLEDETGWVDDATADMQSSSYSLKAGQLQKEGGPVYKVDGGVFTTCRCGGIEKPSWSISAEKADIKLGGLGVAHGATFRVHDIPLLWLPVLPFPANTERQTGFLLPRVSYSNRRGFQYEQPFFWAIDKSSDATVALDVETAARIGVVGEYRYVLSPTARGNITLAYYNQHIGGNENSGVLSPTNGPVETPENRFAIAARHVQPFYYGSQFYVDVFALSDDLFLREINNFSNTVDGDLAIRSTRFTRSRTGVIKTWTGGMAQFDSTFYQDLLDPQELVPQRLPQVRAEHSIPFLDDHVVGRVAAEAVDFQRENGFSGLRGDLAPELFVPFQVSRYLSGSVRGRLRETAYHLTDEEQVGLLVPFPSKQLPARFLPSRDVPRFDVPNLDTNESRELADVHGRIGTEFSRVFDFPHLGLEKLRHSIEPEVQYLFVPQVDNHRFTRQECRVDPNNPTQRECRAVLTRGYLFDELDAINRRNFISYGITTRLLGRGPVVADPKEEVELVEQEDDFVGPPEAAAAAPPPQPTRELLRASILQGYDVSRKIVDDTHLSDVDVGLRLTPADFLGMSYNATWNFQDNDVVGQTVGLVLREPWWTPPPGNNFQGPTTIGVAYNFVQDNVNKIKGIPPGAGFVNLGTEDLNGSVYIRLGDYMGFSFNSRYDLDGGPVVNEEGNVEFVGPGFLERTYLLRLISRCNCWAVDFGVSDRTNPDERVFRLQLTLLGLGSFGKANSGNYVGMAPLQNLGLHRPAALGGSGSSPY